MKEPKDKPELKATLEIIEEDPKAPLDHDTVRELQLQLPLTPAEIAALEREKASLLSELRGRASMHPRPVSVAPVALEPIVLPPSPELQAVTADVDEIEAEIDKLERERVQTERERRATEKAAEDAHKVRVAWLNEKRAAAEAKARELRQLQAAAELQLLSEQASVEEVQERQRQRATWQEKTDTLVVARLKPVFDVARGVRAELEAIITPQIPTLNRLSGMTYKSAPSTWPGELRIEFEQKVAIPAQRISREFAAMLRGLDERITDAGTILSTGWSDNAEFPTELRHVVTDLGYASEYVRSVRETLVEMNDKLHSIFERGGANPKDVPDLIRSHEGLRLAAVLDAPTQEIVETQTRAI